MKHVLTNLGTVGKQMGSGKLSAISMVRGAFAAATFAAILITSGCVGTTGKGSVGGGGSSKGTVAMTVAPAALDFGNLAVGSGSMETVTITNDGTASLTISKLAVTGTGYTIGGLTAPKTLASGQTATLNVAFKATTSGATTGVVTITSNADDSPTAIPLNGGGVTASLSLSPSSLNFGAVTVGTTATQTVKITNTGSSKATISEISVTGADITVSGVSTPATIAAGQSAQVTATFKPTSTSTVSGAVAVTSTASSKPLTAEWTGSGSESSFTVTPASVSFGDVTVGTDATQTIKLANTGNTSVTISKLTTSGSGMSASGLSLPYTLGAGKSTTFTAEFKPTSASSSSGSIGLSTSATSKSVPLSGTGVGSKVSLTSSSSSISFGSVKVGVTQSGSVTVTSSGNANVNISSASVSGTGFSLSGSGGSETLTPDQAQKYTVNFDPKAGGSASGVLTINSNAPNSPMKISLSGTGTSSSPDTSHTVALNWNASKSSVIGYNVYRGTKSSGPYTKLNGSVNTSTSYSDSSVSDGTEYYYVVTSVNSEHVESSDSNQVAVTIPSN